MDPNLQAILGPDREPFETLISDLIRTTNNEQRSQAESLFNLCKQTDPNTLARKLVHLLEHSPDWEARAVSAILLRNLFQENDPNTLRESTRLLVKRGLLHRVVNETDKWTIRKLSDAISMVAANILADSVWPELMPFIFNYVASEVFRLQESALLIFARVAQYVGDSLVPHITRLHDAFMNCLVNEGSADVRIAAFSAVINFILCLQSSSDRDRFQDLLPRMMRCLTEVSNDGDEATAHEATAHEALELLIELVRTEPGFFRGHLVEVVGCMLHIAEAESLEEGTRHLAIEFVITLAEAREQAPEMMMNFPQLISGLFAILTRMLLDIEDNAEWNSAENEDEDESSNSSIGQKCLRRLATALGVNTIVPIACHPNQLPAYLAAPEWQKHLAAVVALAQILEPCSKLTIPILEQMVTMVLNSFQDPHLRVRWAAINAVEQLSTYVGPSFQIQYHDRVLSALDSAPDVQNPRVQAHTVSFMLKFSSHCRPDILPLYLDEILYKLIVPPVTEFDPNIQVLNLANSLEESTDAEIHAMSAILEKLFEEPLAILTKGLVQCKLLRCVAKERNRSALESLCHMIATFYNALCIETGWTELFSFLNQWASSDNIYFKEATMLILGPLRFFTKNCPISLNVYRAFLESDSEHIRIAAFRAAIGYIGCTERYTDVDLVPLMTQMLNEGKEVTTQKALKLLIECAHQTKHLTKDFPGWQAVIPFVRSAIDIAKKQILKKETRHLAIDLVITLGEGRLTNHDLMINELFEILMSDIYEAALYGAENEDDDSGESSNFSVLLKFLDRLAFRLDKDAWTKLEEYLDASEWRKRVIAINILARNFRVYLKATKKDFDLLVKRVVLDQFKYFDGRVRLALVHAIGLLSAALDPTLQLRYHTLVIPFLQIAVDGIYYKQVRKHAASVVVKISKNNPPDNLTPVLLQMAFSELRD